MGNSCRKPFFDPPNKKLMKLAEDIEENTLLLAIGLDDRRRHAPSFETDGYADFPTEGFSEKALKAREAILSLTQELHALVLGPRESLKTLAWNAVDSIPLHAIYAFGIAHAVPDQGISFEDLSQELSAINGFEIPVRNLRRLLRLAICNRIFCEPRPGFIAHNCTSLLLREEEDVAAWVGMFTVDFGPSIARTVDAMKNWPASERSSETGVNVAFNHSLPFFEHIKQDNERARRYDLAMQSHTARERFNVSHTIMSYPWANLGEATVVDMGGGQGDVCFALARVHPSLSFVVQDQLVPRSPNYIGDQHVADRVTFRTHDIFEPQPVVARAYFLRQVLHAFSDADAIRILRALIPALRPGARIIINELVLPTTGSASTFAEKGMRTMDVLMLSCCNSKEREVDEWKHLFEQANAGFKWKRAWKSSGELWFLEVVWEPEPSLEDESVIEDQPILDQLIVPGQTVVEGQPVEKDETTVEDPPVRGDQPVVEDQPLQDQLMEEDQILLADLISEDRPGLKDQSSMDQLTLADQTTLKDQPSMDQRTLADRTTLGDQTTSENQPKSDEEHVSKDAEKKGS